MAAQGTVAESERKDLDRAICEIRAASDGVGAFIGKRAWPKARPEGR